MDGKLRSALAHLNPAELTYHEWISVGMALQAEGAAWQEWDYWSRDDVRYKPGECEQKWKTFRNAPRMVRAGTLIKMARERGWSEEQRSQGFPYAKGKLSAQPTDEVSFSPSQPASGDSALPTLTQGTSSASDEAPSPYKQGEGFNPVTQRNKPSPFYEGEGGTASAVTDEVYYPPQRNKPSPFYEGEGGTASAVTDEVYYPPRRLPLPDSLEPWNLLTGLTPAQELYRYIHTLFRPFETVSYVTSDVYKGRDGRWSPGKGVYTKTAKDIVERLKQSKGNLRYSVGCWKDECGAWIRFNPVDGKGIRNENVTRFTYALVECDTLPLKKQEEILQALQLPIACLVSSGGKSLHAIVPVNASDAEDYRKRVETLYGILERYGYPVDKQNKNPSRLSRMPGVERNGKHQALLGVHLGLASWEDWLAFIAAWEMKVSGDRCKVTGAREKVTGEREKVSGDRCKITGDGRREEALKAPRIEDEGERIKGEVEKESNRPLSQPCGLPAPLSGEPEDQRNKPSPFYEGEGGTASAVTDEVYYPPRGALSGIATDGENTDTLPEIESLGYLFDNMPELPEELIGGVLRKGHKMLISGSSKAGKSFLLMELCIAIAEGREWLGFPCKKGRVLYVNLEIDRPSCIQRFWKIYETLNIPCNHLDDIELWNLRGKAVPLDQLVPRLLKRVRGRHFDAIILDPIYKILMGDENSAADMGRFCNEFDRLCLGTGSAVIYCHHHSKGAQGAKRMMDRASGSGVFSRDPDAQLDLIQLELTDDIRNNVRDGNATAWRVETSLREFPNSVPVNCWFQYPVHLPDSGETLAGLYMQGSPEANLSKKGKRTTAGDRLTNMNRAFDLLNENGGAPVKAMAEYMGVTDRSIRSYVQEFEDRFTLENGSVKRKV